MNILVFSWRDPKHPNKGGAEQVMHEHMKGWIEAGHKVTLFSSRARGLSSCEIIDGVKIIRSGDQYLGVKLAGFCYYLKNKNKIDLVVDQFHGIPFFTPLYVRKPKVAVLQEVAGRVWLKNDLPKPLNLVIGAIGYVLEPLFFVLYKKVIFITGSNSAKSDLERMGIPSGNIRVINHGVIVKRPDPFPQKETIKTILFFGAISKDKGIEEAIRAFKILNELGNYRFWIAGRASKYYVELVNRETGLLRRENRMETWFGYVTDLKKFELMAKAHILINPSVLEGWGLVNIEANALGTPVVAYSSPGLVDSVQDQESGILCKVNSPRQLAENINVLLGNKKWYEAMQRGAVLWSKHFSWEKSKKQSLTLIDHLVLL